jgi:hypothetical protein
MADLERNQKDLLDQATKYADAITAFCVLQSITFAVTTGTADRFADNVAKNVFLVLSLLSGATMLYLLSIHRCHAIEDSLAGKPDTSKVVGTAVRSIRRMRYFYFSLSMLLCLRHSASSLSHPSDLSLPFTTWPHALN